MCVISVVCFVVVISLTLCCRQTPEQTGFVCVGSVYTGLRQVCSLDTGHSLTGTLAYNIGIVASGEIKQVYSADNYKQ